MSTESRKLKRVYVSPFVNSVNRFTTMQIDQLSAFCGAVRGLKAALIDDWSIPRSGKLAVLNWFEDRATVPGLLGGRVVLNVLILLLLRLRVGRIVWFRHNVRPHYLNPNHEKFFVLLEWFLYRVTDVTVTMRPCNDIESMVVPHPRYSHVPHVAERDLDYLWFGSVRPNKHLEWLFERLSPNNKLTMLGRCDDDKLTERLKTRIAERNLNVHWEDRFVADEELESFLVRTKYILMSHATGTAIVSGTFFHAASFGANVILRQSDFSEYAASYPFCHVIRDADTLESAAPAPLSGSEIHHILEERNGEQVVHQAWQNVLRRLGFQTQTSCLRQSV